MAKMMHERRTGHHLQSTLAGRSVILSCNGQRTMRTCLEGAAQLQPQDLSADDFAGASWAFFSAYSMYQQGLLSHAVGLARQVRGDAQSGSLTGASSCRFRIVQSAGILSAYSL